MTDFSYFKVKLSEKKQKNSPFLLSRPLGTKRVNPEAVINYHKMLLIDVIEYEIVFRAYVTFPRGR